MRKYNTADISYEDLGVIMAVANNLMNESKQFELLLNDGVILSNAKAINFAGLDTIRSIIDKALAYETDVRLVMPIGVGEHREKIGNLFGVDVYSDPNIPKDAILVEAEKRG